MTLTRNCPVCDSAEHHPVWGDGVVACGRCGMVYDRAPETFDYAGSHAYSLGDAEPARTAATMQLLRPWLGATALEIGIGGCELLAALGRVTRVVGVDPSRAAVDQATTRGLTAWPVSVYAMAGVVDEPFDLIVMSHVLEHLTAPGDALSLVKRRLWAKGKLYVEVPDATRHLDHLTVPLQEFSREHVNHFSMTLLMRLLLRHGFGVVASGTRSLPLPCGGFYPAMWAICQGVRPAEAELTDAMLPYLMRLYAAEAESRLHRLVSVVLKQLGQEKQLVAWGAGVLSEHLLPMLNGRVAGVVDRDPAKWGTMLAACTVSAPPPRTNLPILISSIVNAGSIERDIRGLGINNRIIKLEESHG